MASNTTRAESTRPPRILVVDDDEGSREMTTEILAYFGCNPAPAATMGMAKVCLSRERYDLVILDVELPGGNGLDLAALIRSGAESFATDKAVPIIIASGHTNIDRKAEYLGLQAEVRVKPMDPLDLVSLLRRLLPWHPFKPS
jgi:DNA-binding response OmpR family regulator